MGSCVLWKIGAGLVVGIIVGKLMDGIFEIWRRFPKLCGYCSLIVMVSQNLASSYEHRGIYRSVCLFVVQMNTLIIKATRLMRTIRRLADVTSAGHFWYILSVKAAIWGWARGASISSALLFYCSFVQSVASLRYQDWKCAHRKYAISTLGIRQYWHVILLILCAQSRLLAGRCAQV